MIKKIYLLSFILCISYAEPVPLDVEKLIKKKYPETWEEYIKVY